MNELYVMAAYAFFMLAVLLYPMRNYPTDKVVSELFDSFVRAGFDVARNGHYELHLRGPMGEIRCWNANRWYAWASEGTFTPHGTAEPSILWKNRMPGRMAARRMRNAVEAAEIARLSAAERGAATIDLDDYRESGYALRRLPAGSAVPHGVRENSNG